MPSILDLNAFKNAVNQLGSEPDVVQARNEILEDIQQDEESVSLMPELWASNEAQVAESNAEASKDPAIALSSETEGTSGEGGSETEVPPEEESPHPLPPELDELSEERTEQGNTQANEQVAATVPQSVYQMLDTGFGDLDSEGVSLDILGSEDASIPISNVAGRPTLASSLFDHELEAVAEAPPTLGESEEASQKHAEEPLEDAESGSAVAGIPPDEAENPVDPVLASLGGGGGGLPTDEDPDKSDEGSREDSNKSGEEPARSELEEQDVPTPPFARDLAEGPEQLQMEGAPLVELGEGELLSDTVAEEDLPNSAVQSLDSITELEQALQEHRSVDLLNIGVEEVEESEDNEYEELEFRISHERARDFLLQLGSYPIVLKIAIEEEIGENELGEEAVETLVELVSSGSNPRQVANYFFSQTGKRIVLTKGQRYHAADRSDLSFRFHRQFAQVGVPLIRHAFLGVLLLAMLFWLPFYYIYRPIQSYLYYQKGYNEIYHDDFNRAERYFTLATNGWPLLNDKIFVKGWPYRSWYLNYANAYAERRDFAESTFKLRKVLRFYPDYKEAWYRYILLLSQEMGEYSQAENIIQQYYDRFGRDYTSLIFRGVNYLDWGEIDPVYYPEAHQIFGAIYTLESKDDLPLLYLLDYYIRTSSYNRQEEQLEKLTSFFLESDPTELEVPSKLFARIMSKTADYYFSNGNIEVGKKLLFNANQVSKDSMEVHRSLARYYNITKERSKERDALDASRYFLNYRNDYDTTPNLLEKLSLTKQQAQFLATGTNSLEASFVFNNLLIQLNAAGSRLQGFNHLDIAEDYTMLGNFYYENIPNSLSPIPYYEKATGLGMADPYLHYRYGYLLYQREDFESAVDQFLQSQLLLNTNNKVKYALGNSLLRIGSYNSAQGILEEAYTALQEELRISFLTDPQHSGEARDRLFMLIRLANDLGVSYYREALQSPNIKNKETAMAYLIQGMNYLDILGREDTVNLKLPPELLFRPRLLTKKTINMLEQAIPAQGLVPGSLADRNLKQMLESKISTPTPNNKIQPYWVDILSPELLQETMNY